MWSCVVVRTACVDVPALPLQVLLRALGNADGVDLRRLPVAVVDRDKPQGTILWVNEAARRSRILPGMRYAAGLSLSSDLRAGVVSPEEIEDAVQDLTERLWRFSPEIEPGPGEPGVFWMVAEGILPLYDSLTDWARCIRSALREASLTATVAVGFTRFGSYATARSCGTRRGLVVFGSRGEEALAVRQVPIDRLGFQPKLRDTLSELGVDQLGGFLDLPSAGIRRRFGKEAHALHALAASETASDLNPVPLAEPLERSLILDRPVADSAQVLAGVRSMLAPLLVLVRRRQHAVRRLTMRLLLDNNEVVEESLEPAEPTVDERQLLNLVNLRLTKVPLSAGVVEEHLELVDTPMRVRQGDLFTAPPRDLAAARRALARIRAEFGDSSVVHAYLQEGHLPEARYGLAAFGQLDVPRPEAVGERPVVRRFFAPPIPLPMRSKFEPDGWILDFADGPVDEVVGPHVIHGGWWLREVRRDYYYARTRNGRWLWLYHDRCRRRWFLQGEIE